MLLPIALVLSLCEKFVSWKWVRLPVVSLGAVFILWQFYYCLADATGWEARRQFQGVKQVLADPLYWNDRSGLSSEQSIIGLSLLGEGLADYALRFPAAQAESRLLTENALQAMLGVSTSPFENVRDTSAWEKQESNLYLSHLNMLLGSYSRQVPQGEPNAYAALHAQLSRYLTARLLAAPTRNAPSYGETPDSLWVADNAVTLQSLFLHDRLARTNASARLRQQWVAFVTTKGARADGLPFSELTGRRPPRGCANSWIAKYGATAMPAFTATLWSQYKHIFKYNLGLLSVFREYPVENSLPADYDSGPILYGAGAAAIGLALCGAKYQGDYYTYYQLINGLKVAELGACALTFCLRDEQWASASGSWLSKAIQFNGASHR